MPNGQPDGFSYLQHSLDEDARRRLNAEQKCVTITKSDLFTSRLTHFVWGICVGILLCTVIILGLRWIHA